MKTLTFSGSLYDEKLTLKRITKRTAKKLFFSGGRIFIQSANFTPFGRWSQAIELEIECSFDEFCNSFEYYNCQNNETGKYAAFYTNI